MIELGEKIKAAREAHSISYESISDVTKINEKYLKQIEEGNWEFLPQPYVRAFVKLFANEVGLDGQQILREYDRLLVEKAHSLSPLPKEINEIKKSPLERKEFKQTYFSQILAYFKKYKNESIIIGLALVLLLILVLVYSQKSEAIFDESMDDITELPIDSLVISQPDTFKPMPETEESLELLLRAKEETWVAISVDDSTSMEYTFYPGNSKMWFGKEHFSLRLGNARGVELFLNGQPVKLEKRKERVLNVDIRSDSITEK